MAPSPEYDKEPKAPDKNAANSLNDELKISHGTVSEQTNSDNRTTTAADNIETEEIRHADGQWRALLDEAVPYNKCPKERDGKANLFKENKHVETLDDGQLRALLDEAITYKCPKDREGKSSLFKELLEEVEQDEQACEAACAGGGARGWANARSRNARGLNACGSNSLQDLVAAALAAEAAPRRRHAPVSARTHHGGSLPSGVDRSFLLGEEPVRMGAGVGAGGGGAATGVSGVGPPAAGCSGAGGGGSGGAEYVATVRCVNPTPLTERRVSASDAHNSTEMELINRRSKMPMFPAMYTARTTLEIGSGSVCSGRAVTTTTASNQVRTRPRRLAPAAPPTCGPPERLYVTDPHQRHGQHQLLTALDPRAARCVNNGSARTNGGGRLPHNVQYTDRRNEGSHAAPDADESASERRSRRKPRGPHYADGAYVPEPILRPKKYSVEEYCKKKCKEDRTKTYPDAGQDYQPRKQTHAAEPVPQKKFSRFDNCNYNHHNNTNQAPHSNSAYGHAQKFRNKTRGRQTDNTAFASKQGSDMNVVFTEPNTEDLKLDNVDVYNVQSDCCVPKTIRNASLGSPIETKYWQRRPSWGSCENVKDDNDVVAVEIEAKTDLGVIENDHSTNVVNNSEQVVSVVNELVEEGSNEIILKETDACQSSLKRHNPVSHNECKIDIESPEFRDNVPIPNSGCDGVTSQIGELKNSHGLTILSQNDERNVKIDSGSELSKDIVGNNNIGPNSALDDKQSQNDDNENLRRIQRSIISLKDKLRLKSSNLNRKKDIDRIIEEAVSDEIEFVNSEFVNEANEKALTVYNGDHSRTGYTVVTFPVYEPSVVDQKSSKTGTETDTDGRMTAHYSKTAFVLLPYTRENDDRVYNLKPLNLSDNAGMIPNSLLPILSDSGANETGAANEILIFEPSRRETEGLFSTVKMDNAPQVDAGVPFNCITTPEVVASCNTTPSSLQSALAVDPKPRSVIASSFNGLPLARTNYGATSASAADDYKKSLDENGNAVTPLCSTLYGSSQHKKPRRKKSSKNETIIDLNLVDGYRGDKDVTELLRFIEPDAEHGRGQKLGRLAKHRDDDKKRSSERRARDRESRVKRASSLEELSRTTLEDLTDKPAQAQPQGGRHKKERWADAANSGTATAHKSERRSWGDDARDAFYYDVAEEVPPSAAAHPTPPAPASAAPSASPPETPASPTASAAPAPVAVTPPAPAAKEKKKTKSGSKSADSTPAAAQEPASDTQAVELMDFTTVTNKKKKPRKRFEENDRDGSTAGDLHYRKPKPASPERRRKSAPPSDKSNDSNDDMDSVHSLPADTAQERSSTAPAPSAGGTPQASYADIARTRHNIPDLIESCNFYTDVDAASGAEDKSPRRRDAALASPPDPAIVEAVRRLPSAGDEPLALAAHAYDSENYPALDSRTQRAKPKESKGSPPHKRPDKKCRSLPDSQRAPSAGKGASASADEGEGEGEAEGAGAGGSPPDVVADRRPPVILLVEAQRPRDMDGITFGFDVNEQLLNGEGEGCDLVPGVPVRAGLRYLPPPRPAAHHHHHDQIVHYVGSAWEDIVRCGSGKVRYFSE